MKTKLLTRFTFAAFALLASAAVAQRAAGVGALAPLGACFLPAFLLLAVLPMVAGVATTILR